MATSRGEHFHLYFDEASKTWNEARGGGESVGTSIKSPPSWISSINVLQIEGILQH